MALRRNQTHRAGDVVRFRVPRGCRVMVTAPDTMHLEIPAPTGVVDLWLAQAGEWLVEWPKGREVLQVTAAEPAEDAVVARAASSIPRTVKPRQFTGGA
jgi:hypothetical protein